MHKADTDQLEAARKANESKEGDTNDAFVKLVKDNYGMYIKKCYSYLKCPSLAEDAVQEGILAAHLKLATVQDKAALGAWLYRIIVHKAIDSLRKSQNFPSFDGNLEELVSYNKHGLLNAPVWSEVSNPEQEILKKEGLKQIKEAVEMLTDVYRIPLLLKDFEGFSIREISEILQVSESNVKVRIHRGRIKLRGELSDYFFPSKRGVSK